MKVRAILFISFCLFFVCYSVSFAARPLATDDAGVVDKGHFEVESGMEYVNQLDKEVALSLVIKRGIIDNLDLGIEIPYKFVDFGQGAKTDGFDDISIVSKYNFLEETATLPAMSVSFSLKTDSGNDDKSLGTGEKEYGVNAILSKSLDKIALHFNLGYVLKDNLPEQNLRDVLTYGFAIEYPLNDSLNLVGEITGENERRGDFDDNSMSG
ncbi:MAG: transporter, partial [Candidatus Omnitrophota bacterium]